MNPIKDVLTYMNKDKIIREQAKRNNEIIYGSQAIRKQIGFFGREPKDYDVLSSHPQASAKQLETSLDKSAEANLYYSKPSRHKGTWKVKNIGADYKKGTEDDIDIADYTQMKQVKTKVIDGVRYADIQETLKDKEKSTKNKEFAYRHGKDCEDISRIRFAQKMMRGR